jgi:hypothetical protein
MRCTTNRIHGPRSHAVHRAGKGFDGGDFESGAAAAPRRPALDKRAQGGREVLSARPEWRRGRGKRRAMMRSTPF